MRWALCFKHSSWGSYHAVRIEKSSIEQGGRHVILTILSFSLVGVDQVLLKMIIMNLKDLISKTELISLLFLDIRREGMLLFPSNTLAVQDQNISYDIDMISNGLTMRRKMLRPYYWGIS
jgi:hypothetical protein